MLITLHDSKAAAVIDSIGAQLISFKDSAGTEYIWQRDPQFWPRCSPLLFPIVGNCRNNQTILEDRIWNIHKHGFCREMEFSASNQTDTSVTFHIRDTEETKNSYPYSFRLSLAYSLHDGILRMEYQVTNTDERTMYYCLGAHPGFNCPFESGAEFEDHDLVFEKEEQASSMVYDSRLLEFNPEKRVEQLNHSRILPLSRNLFKDDAVYFDSLKSKKVSLINRNTGRGVKISFPDFETVAFWTPYPEEAPFICIEPWNGSAVYTTEDELFIHKNHVQTLSPGGKKNYGLSISIQGV
jgi:galactose mutarotase-like enzyme